MSACCASVTARPTPCSTGVARPGPSLEILLGLPFCGASADAQLYLIFPVQVNDISHIAECAHAVVMACSRTRRYLFLRFCEKRHPAFAFL
jgi:hypothetical protein